MLIDSHCHPTDSPELVSEVENVPLNMCIMSTRLDDIDLVAHWADRFPHQLTPAFGLHPWYSYLLATTPGDKLEHYQSVLEPPPNETEAADLPSPIPLSEYLAKLRALLIKYPNALLGEVGLDKPFKVKVNDKLLPFRVKMTHQRTVLASQLRIAEELGRSASLHGVQAAQPLFDEVKKFPKLRAVCLHSYGGSADFYKQIWSRLDVPVYVSIAILINGRMPQPKLQKLLEALDPKYVLSESDMNRPGSDQVELVKQSVKLFADHFHWEDAEVKIEENYRSFIGC